MKGSLGVRSLLMRSILRLVRLNCISVIGLITPPAGINVFVMKGVAPHINPGDIAYGAPVCSSEIFGVLLLI